MIQSACCISIPSPKRTKLITAGGLRVFKARGSSITVSIIEHSFAYGPESRSPLTCQMPTWAGDAPFVQTMTIQASAGYQADWFEKLRCHMDDLIPHLTGAESQLLLFMYFKWISWISQRSTVTLRRRWRRRQRWRMPLRPTQRPYQEQMICMEGQQGRVSGKTWAGHQIWMSQFHEPRRVKMNIWWRDAHVSLAAGSISDRVDGYSPPGELELYVAEEALLAESYYRFCFI